MDKNQIAVSVFNKTGTDVSGKKKSTWIWFVQLGAMIYSRTLVKTRCKCSGISSRAGKHYALFAAKRPELKILGTDRAPQPWCRRLHWAARKSTRLRSFNWWIAAILNDSFPESAVWWVVRVDLCRYYLPDGRNAPINPATSLPILNTAHGLLYVSIPWRRRWRREIRLGEKQPADEVLCIATRQIFYWRREDNGFVVDMQRINFERWWVC